MTVQSSIAIGSPAVSAAWSARLLRLSALALVAAVWVSAALFGLYIVMFYAGALAEGTPAEWNAVLPRLYEPQTPLATIGIGAHFAAGGILLLLGPVQLIARIRQAAPAVHRWIGRLYVLSALAAGLGGLGFIAAKGTIGGTPMDVGFAGYGLLTVLAAAETWRHARARRRPARLERHRAWAIRLFALAIGSWLYRMDYGFWFLVTGGIGHTDDFSGWFDVVMAFFFYIPNLIVAEAFIRARSAGGRPWLQAGAGLLLLAATAFVALATWEFTLSYWWPGIVHRLA